MESDVNRSKRSHGKDVIQRHMIKGGRGLTLTLVFIIGYDEKVSGVVAKARGASRGAIKGFIEVAVERGVDYISSEVEPHQQEDDH